MSRRVIFVAFLAIVFGAQAQASGQVVTSAPKLSARAETTTTIHTATRRADSGLLPLPAAGIPAGLEPFFELSNSDIKFSFSRLTEILRDKKHEGWVLSPYPDPKTSDPLIGAGFTLSLPAREHPQSDPLNPYQFLEPSSEQLWQAAGFDTQRLNTILAEYQSNLEAWGTRKYRKKIRTQAHRSANRRRGLEPAPHR